MQILWVTVIVLQLLLVSADDISDRGTNAANVAQAGLDACRNSNSNIKGNTIPYLTSNSYMCNALGIIGGTVNFYLNRQMEKQLKDSLNQLNQRFDRLQNDINDQLNQLQGIVDMTKFLLDIAEPTSILWGEMRAYAQYPNNCTYANMMSECSKQAPWQIATKLHNGLFGPENTLMSQIASNQYSNATFMATKNTIMYPIFQLTMVQSFCAGMMNGPNINFSQYWEMQRMYSIYSDIANNMVAMRKVQEKDYFQAMVPQIVKQIVVGVRDYGQYQNYANQIHDQLSPKYPWDNFGIVVADADCSHVDGHEFLSNPVVGGAPYAAMQVTVNSVWVWVIRYWKGYQQGSRKSSYTNCMASAKQNDPDKWGESIRCGQSYNVLADTWYCGDDTKTTGEDSMYYVDGATYKDGISSAVYPNANRPTTVEYDLGFWERPIGISLLPIAN